ncbi:uncharacterized protein SPPG_04167 [Spizellomyces punctatus DAOM BR117]|uniref:Pre-mRNA-splicing factor cwc2 n=1 Tax=Spizellomyces punctatus (strain DAOM BR117) TaxID=645134 RepID=A0A0L0HI18_SPIPD|nr:uncharacterized protein SPPG_04167 [Spizellomyces punctatus DAOM BR117]KND01076.1 hypothetical protein SPPG_04167 [Spizellomyces punctatus DAOM BR117]|eukprot:XP_016609115.1 hypothetical protein SPPG_04167 [Spizellomyces punctatus DAOM BR117]
MDRPARKQVSAPAKATVAADQAGTYNIWYNRWTGEGRKRNALEKAEHRCKIARDMGYTKAQTGSSFCVHFARGCCMKGHTCSYWHRIPLPEDREIQAHDIFGRERFREDRDDMGGVGSFERDNRTLYIGNIKAPQSEMEEVVRRHFSEWGEIEHINILPHKSVAFVRYVRRSNAEFAREAMYGQSLDSNEILNVRWATEDPNPRVKEEKKRKVEAYISEALQQKLPVIGDQGNILDYEGYYAEAPPAKAAKVEEESAISAALRDASNTVFDSEGRAGADGTYNGWQWDGTAWRYVGDQTGYDWQAYYQSTGNSGTYDEEAYRNWYYAHAGQADTGATSGGTGAAASEAAAADDSVVDKNGKEDAKGLAALASAGYGSDDDENNS